MAKLPMTAAILFATGAASAWSADPAVSKTQPGAAGPTQAVLLSLESSAYRAWKTKDTKFWEAFLADNFVGWGASGRIDKASAAKEYAGADCQIQSYRISDPQMTALGRDVALITHKVVVDGTCGGQKNPSASWAASAYVRDGKQWKAAFHTEAAIVDPAAAATQPLGKPSTAEPTQSQSAERLAATNVLLPLEKAIWEAWKDHDRNRLDGLTASKMQFINIFGVHLATKAEALKNWSGEGCDVKTIALRDAAATMLSPTVGILTFRASADGTCFGQKVGPVWGSSIYVKDGATWKWNFGINVPAQSGGG